MIPILPAAIDQVLTRLCKQRPEWGTQNGAFSQCTGASTILLRILDTLHEPCDILPISVHRLNHPHPHWERFRGKEHCIAHYAAHLYRHHAIVDLTARQFDIAALFPHITRF